MESMKWEDASRQTRGVISRVFLPVPSLAWWVNTWASLSLLFFLPNPHPFIWRERKSNNSHPRIWKREGRKEGGKRERWLWVSPNSPLFCDLSLTLFDPGWYSSSVKAIVDSWNRPDLLCCSCIRCIWIITFERIRPSLSSNTHDGCINFIYQVVSWVRLLSLLQTQQVM